MSLAMLSINSYAAPLVIVKPEIQKIVSYGGKWHIVYNEVQNSTNLTTEEVFIDGNSDRIVNVGTSTKRGFPLKGVYSETACHKAYIIVYDNTHSIVATSDTFNFGDTTNCTNVIVNDTISPVITLNGTNPQVLSIGDAYTELGALANDNRDGDITNNITIDASAVNVNTVGDYDVTYTVLDAAGNDTTVTRVVKVVALGTAQKPEIHRVKYYGGKWTIVYKDVKISSAYTTESVFIDNVLDREVNAGSSSTLYDRGFSLANTNYSQATCHEAYIVVYDNTKTEVTRSDVFNFGDLTKCGDMVKPEITLTGVNPQVLTVGDTYTELGATALDNVDGDITGNIVIDATAVDTTKVGTYSVTYNISDAAGNAATTLTRSVIVEAAVPVVTTDILAVKYYSSRWNILFIDLPASPTLGKEEVFVDGVLDRIVNAGTTSPSLKRGFRLLGTYSQTSCHEAYIVTYDNSGLELSRTTKYNFGDTTKCGADIEKPVITLVGVNPQQLTVGDVYTELGATASDDRDGDITGNIVIDASAVNVAVAGSYVVTYNVVDAAGNTAVTLNRTVNVLAADVTKPVLTLVGANVQLIVLGQAYIELGATASDDRDGDITGNIVINAAVNTAAVGSYTVTYNVSDAAGNVAVELTRTVTVQAAEDTIKPVITLSGANPQTIIFGHAYTELGATALDNVDGDISANIVIDASAVNTNVTGQYIVRYISTDIAGNTATVNRVVNVTSAPTTTGNYYISLTGSDSNDGRTLGTAFKTIAHALDVAVGGDTILMKGGTYRQGEIRFRKENNTGQYITLQNYNNEDVVIKGSAAVNGWENYQDNIWKLSATDTSGLNKNVHYQQVFYGDGKRLQKIGYPNYDTTSNGVTTWRAYFPRYKAIKTNAANPFGMSEGTFYVKALANGQFDLYVWLPNGKTPNDADVTMEVSDKKYLIDAFTVNNFKIKGLRFMHTASAAYGKLSNGFQGGAGLTLGKNAILEDSEIAYMDFAAINLSLSLSPLGTDMNQVIRGNKIHHNGDVGISAIAGGYLVDGNEFYENSDRPFLQYWHSGAIKTSANGWGEIKDNYIHDERGQGIWFDNCHSNNPILVHHNYIDGVGNKKANDPLRLLRARGHGIFFEESTNVRTYNNIINMTEQRGVYISLSKDVVLSNNLIRKSFLEQIAVRYRKNYGVIKLENVKIVNNILMDKRYAGDRPFDVKAFDENSAAVFNPNNEFSGNIIYNTDGTTPKIAVGGSHWTFSDNILSNPLLITNGSTLLNTWTLDGQSPAVNAGTNYPFITDDNRHNPRNDGTSDIGAFEK
jgi:parallel beta-helix repeat protein